MSKKKKPRNKKYTPKHFSKEVAGLQWITRMASKSQADVNPESINAILLETYIALDSLARGDMNKFGYIKLVQSCGICAHLFAQIAVNNVDVIHTADHYATLGMRAIDACEQIGKRSESKTDGRLIATGEELKVIRETVDALSDISTQVTEGMFVRAMAETGRPSEALEKLYGNLVKRKTNAHTTQL